MTRSVDQQRLRSAIGTLPRGDLLILADQLNRDFANHERARHPETARLHATDAQRVALADLTRGGK